MESATGDRRAAALEAIARNPTWYHTLELAPGVLTPGQIDLRAVAPKLLPDDLSGLRALDVGTFDGFWSFEMERRGAEVVAIDVEEIEAAEWPPLHRPRLEREAREFDVQLGRGFRLASELFGSAVERVVCNAYDVAPERIGGPVDFAFCGALLLHLRDPVRVLERIRASLGAGGRLFQLEPVSLRRSILARRTPLAEFQAVSTPFNWWTPNVAALRAWLAAAGFTGVERHGFHRPPARDAMRGQWYCGMSARSGDD
jgi:tRNA (mo5U34)-methyltransferase